MACFGMKQGQDLENWAAHPHHEFRGVPYGAVLTTSDTDCSLSQLKHYNCELQKRFWIREIARLN